MTWLACFFGVLFQRALRLKDSERHGHCKSEGIVLVFLLGAFIPISMVTAIMRSAILSAESGHALNRRFEWLLAPLAISTIASCSPSKTDYF